jgi:hypothetical protein
MGVGNNVKDSTRLRRIRLASTSDLPTAQR